MALVRHVLGKIILPETLENWLWNLVATEWVIVSKIALLRPTFWANTSIPTDNCKPLCGINSSTNLTANQTKLKNFTSAATEFWEYVKKLRAYKKQSITTLVGEYSCTWNLYIWTCLRRRMLQMSDSLEELGSVSWELALCLLISWTFCYFCIWKSIKSSGKVRP